MYILKYALANFSHVFRGFSSHEDNKFSLFWLI